MNDLRDQNIEFSLHFAQVRRTTRQGYAYYAGTADPDHSSYEGTSARYVDDKAFDRDIDGERIATVGKKQRELINNGIDYAEREDHAMRRCVRSGGSFLKKMCCMLPVALSMKGVES